MSDYLLDTNVLILHFRNRPDVTTQLTQWGLSRTLYTSVVTRTELLAGMYPHEEQETIELLDSLVSLSVDEAIADQAGRLIYQYARQGVQLSFPDAQIASTALLHNLTLVTTNIKHFPMPELNVQPLV